MERNTIFNNVIIKVKDVETLLKNAIREYEKGEGETKLYWKGAGHAYQALLINFHKGKWDTSIVESVVW